MSVMQRLVLYCCMCGWEFPVAISLPFSHNELKMHQKLQTGWDVMHELDAEGWQMANDAKQYRCALCDGQYLQCRPCTDN